MHYNFVKKGYQYILLNKDNKNFIKLIKKEIDDYLKKKKIILNNLSNKQFHKLNYILQKKINIKFNPKKFFILNKYFFINFFKNKNFAIQSYFYLRMVQPERKDSTKPIDLHRETFQGPAFYKSLINIWIPIANCEKSNAINYIPNSHKYIKNKEFSFKLRKTNIEKGSYAHKTGLLYKDRELFFKNKVRKKKLFKKNHYSLFSGELIHGAGTNKTNKIRISIDLRFMLQKHLITNPIQGATQKKYFQKIKL